jgi:hypothetical protein
MRIIARQKKRQNNEQYAIFCIVYLSHASSISDAWRIGHAVIMSATAPCLCGIAALEVGVFLLIFLQISVRQVSLVRLGGGHVL